MRASEDVDAALRALEPAAKPRLHVFLATSDLHLKHKLRIARRTALEQIAKMVRFGAEQIAKRWSFRRKMRAARTSVSCCEVIAAAAKAGATIINLPDTVGYAMPEEYGRYVPRVRAIIWRHIRT